MSLIISPEIPAVVATLVDDLAVMTVQGEATRTISPFQQVNSSVSEHQRSFEWLVVMAPSCVRRTRRQVCRANRSPYFFISRQTRLALTGSWPAARRSRLRTAVIRLNP